MKKKHKHDSAERQFFEPAIDYYLKHETHFHPTPLKGVAQQRSELKHRMLEFLEMKHLKEELSAGITGLKKYFSKQFSVQKCKELQDEFQLLNERMVTPEIINEKGTDFVELLGISPELIHTMDDAGTFYSESGEYKTAAGIYAILSIIQFNNPRNLCYRGLCYHELSEFSEAINSFKGALVISHGDPGILLFLADSLNMSGDRKGAAERLKEAEKIIQSNTDLIKKWRDYEIHLKHAIL